jgi:hypothetical protein
MGIRRAVVAPLTALMLLMSVAVPMLDVSDLTTEVAVESQHDPASCAPAHDHVLCTQVSANHAAPTRPGARVRATLVLVHAPLGAMGAAPGSPLATGHPTRGPPSV